MTGATSGIGLAFAEQLAGRGHDLVLVARDARRLEETARRLGSAHGVTCTALPADLSRTEGLASVAAVASDLARPVGLLVNNAGFGLGKPFDQTSIEDEQRCLDVLVTAPMHLMHAALPAMTARGRGAIVNVASVAGFTPRGTYAAHKAWLISFSRWAAIEYAGRGVTVMALCPGFVRTEFHARMDADLSGIPGWMWLSAPTLVRAALHDLDRGVAVSVPTWRYKLLAAAARHAPARVVARAARRGR